MDNDEPLSPAVIAAIRAETRRIMERQLPKPPYFDMAEAERRLREQRRSLVNSLEQYRSYEERGGFSYTWPKPDAPWFTPPKPPKRKRKLLKVAAISIVIPIAIFLAISIFYIGKLLLT